jgi:two-component system CheB/CheR fusion protein
MDTPEDSAFARLLKKLHEKRGLDFNDYRPSFIRRNMEARLSSLNIKEGDFAAYEKFIAATPRELDLLFDKLTVNVTEFFRDPPVWEFLTAEIIRPLLAKATRPIRIWSAGCAAGEEPYTLGIIVAEQMRMLSNKPDVRIFASDVDPISISRAKAAFYNTAALAKVSPQRVKIFFDKKDGYYEVSSAVTSLVRFVEHSYLTPPIATQIDFISCRNSMIYLNKEAREKALMNFHSALVPGGTLVLGSTEVLLEDRHQKMFEALPSQASIFRKRPE